MILANSVEYAMHIKEKFLKLISVIIEGENLFSALESIKHNDIFGDYGVVFKSKNDSDYYSSKVVMLYANCEKKIVLIFQKGPLPKMIDFPEATEVAEKPHTIDLNDDQAESIFETIKKDIVTWFSPLPAVNYLAKITVNIEGSNLKNYNKNFILDGLGSHDAYVVMSEIYKHTGMINMDIADTRAFIRGYENEEKMRNNIFHKCEVYSVKSGPSLPTSTAFAIEVANQLYAKIKQKLL